MEDRMNRWFVGIRDRKPGDDPTDITGMTVLEPPAGHYQADPFLAQHSGEDWLFTELYDYDRGRIAVQQAKSGAWSAPLVVFDPGYHVSFPALLWAEDRWIMTPEEGRGGVLRILESRSFPEEWTELAVIAHGVFADPVLVRAGTGWLCYATEAGDHYLRVFEAPALTGPWTLRAARDEINSRNAGHVFQHEGRLMRPVQNCVYEYGLNVILKDATSGIVVRNMAPWKEGLTGFHTLNFNSRYVVVDGRIRL